MSCNYIVQRDSFHRVWSRDLQPVIRIKPDDTVRFEVDEVSGGLLTRNTKVEDYMNLDTKENDAKFYPLAGPVDIEGASPGDTLEIHVIDMKVADWGWSGLRPSQPPLVEMADYFFHIWDLSNGKYASFKKGIRIPLRPFPGTIGVAPKEHGTFDIQPPREENAGNLDIRYLTAGSVLLLPVQVNGALFSVGDPHAAQGDGELGTALESPAEVTLRFAIQKGKKIPSAQYFAPVHQKYDNDFFATTGTSPDLMEATRLAARHMIEHLMSEYDLSSSEALMLCGLAGDLRLHQVVNYPNWTVGLTMPLEIFKGNS